MISHSLNNWSKSIFLISGGNWKWDFEVKAYTCMPKPMATRAVVYPVFPNPTRPIFLSLSSISGVSQKQKSLLFAQRPLCTSSEWCCTCWQILRICANTICATEAVLYAGMLVTMMPRSFAAAVSTTLYPVASTPIYFSSGRAAMWSALMITLFVRITSAPAARSNTSSGAVRS